MENVYNWKGWYERDTIREGDWSRHVSRNCFWDGYRGRAGSLLVNYFHCPRSHSQKSWQKLTRAGPLSFLKWRMRETAVKVIWVPHSQNPSDMGIPVTLTLTQIAKGMPILQWFWEWGCSKRGDANITVTPPSQVKTVIIKYTHNKAKLQS